MNASEAKSAPTDQYTPVSPRIRARLAPAFATKPGAKALRDPATALALFSSGESILGGRSEHRLLPAADWGHAVRLRPARRGGALAKLSGDRFLTPNRTLREFDRTSSLREAGVSVAEPVFALSIRSGLLWQSAFASIDQPASFDGQALFESDPTDSRLYAAAISAGRALRALHDAGVLHGDLQLRNLLFSPVDQDAPNALCCQLIDLDHARSVSTASPSDRMHEWMRLVRSLEKNGFAARLTSRHHAAGLRAYCQGDRALRRSMLRHLPKEKARVLRHRIGWRLRSLLPALAALATIGVFALAGCGAEDRVESPPEDARFSLLAVGDTGRIRPFATLSEGQLAVASGMSGEAATHPIDGVVLLGDNFYTDGLDPETLVPRIRANLVRPYCAMLRLDGPRSGEVESACGTPLAERRAVPFYAVLGNHDIELPESATLQRDAVPDFVPGWKMAKGLAETFELGSGISLILFESETQIDDREAIIQALRTSIRESQGPWRILATHRPIATDDLGTPWLGGYPSFVRDAIEAEGLPVQLVLAGHHHSLQAFEVEKPPFLQLGLGSGSRAEPPLASPDHPDVRFSRMALGFARIDLVGTGAEEHLVATLIQTARWPILSPIVPPRPVARFAIDQRGRRIPVHD